MSMIKATTEIITPQTAQEMLDSMLINRALSPKRVNRFARDMAAGEWEMNGSTIVIDKHGSLIDGQTRLHACILSGDSFQTLVVRGVNGSAFATIDSGASRTTSDVFKIDGEKYWKLLAPASRALWQYSITESWQSLGSSNIAPSPAEIRSFLADNPMIRDSVKFVQPLRFSGMVPPSLMAALHFAFRKRSPAIANWFVGKLATGLGLSDTDPVYHLRERLTSDRMSKQMKLSASAKTAYIIKAWMMTRRGQKLTGGRAGSNLRVRRIGPTKEHLEII